MKRALIFLGLVAFATRLSAQIQVDLKLPRMQYIAYEPVVVTVGITNLAGRDIELHDSGDQPWFGFEVTSREGQPVPPAKSKTSQPPLKIEAGQTRHPENQRGQHVQRGGFRRLSRARSHLFSGFEQVFLFAGQGL